MLGWYDLQWAGEGRRLQGELLRRQRDLRPGDPANIQFTSGAEEAVNPAAAPLSLSLSTPAHLSLLLWRPLSPRPFPVAVGTTGFPKAATLSHHGILNNGLLVGAACRYTESDRQDPHTADHVPCQGAAMRPWAGVHPNCVLTCLPCRPACLMCRVCIPVPLFHCFGSVMGNLACAAHGAAAVYPSGVPRHPPGVFETWQAGRGWGCCSTATTHQHLLLPRRLL